jgi:hypothetical protein
MPSLRGGRSARFEADAPALRPPTGCPCGCMTKLPWLDDPDCTMRRIPSPSRDLLAWQSTVEHLHAAGLPAPAPEFAAAWLRRRGVRPDWETAA